MATKPVLQHIANERPLSLDDNLPIVKQKNGSLWSNKTALTNYVDSLYVHPDSDTYLYVKCGCGEEYSYTTKTSVPSSNTTCTCGRKIIEYGS